MQLGKLKDFWETDEDLVAEDVGREVHTRLGLFGEGSLNKWAMPKSRVSKKMQQ